MASDAWREATALVLTEVTPEMAETAEALGYGLDAWCQFDVKPNWENQDPYSPEGITNQIVRMLIVTRGSLREAQNRGIDIRRMWNTKMTRYACDEIAARVKAEVLENDRVKSADVTCNPETTRSVQLKIRFVPKDVGETFELVFRLSEGKAELL